MNLKKYKRVFFIENDCTVANLLLSDSLKNKDSLVVSINYLASYKLDECGISYLMPSDFFDKSDYYKLHKITDHFEQSWFIDSNKADYSVFDSVSFGEMTSGMLSRSFFASIIVYYTQLLNKIKHDHDTIGDVFYDFSNDDNYFGLPESCYAKFFKKGELFAVAAKQLGLTAHHLKPDHPIPSAHIPLSHRHRHRLARVSIKKFKKMAYFVVNIISDVKNGFKSSNKTLIPLYFNQKSLLTLDLKGVIVTHFPLSTLIKNPRLFLSGVKVCDIKEVNVSNEGLDLFLERMRSKISSLYGCELFRYKGVDYKFLYVPIINEIVRSVIPRLCIDLRKTRAYIFTNNISKIIVNNANTEENRLLITAAHLENRKTFFVDHGIQGHVNAKSVHDRIPVSAYITPGSFKNYPIDADTVALGNPCIDPYRLNVLEKNNKIKRILFLSFEDNFYARMDRLIGQERYYKIIFNAAKKLHIQGYSVYFRGHFENEEYISYLFEYFDMMGILKKARAGSFESVIKDYDLLICNITTCFYESMAAGIPAVFVEPTFINGSINPPFNGHNWDEIIRVDNSDEIVSIVNNPVEIKSYLDNFYDKHLDTYIGKVDGKSSERIMDYVNKYETG